MSDKHSEEARPAPTQQQPSEPRKPRKVPPPARLLTPDKRGKPGGAAAPPDDTGDWPVVVIRPEDRRVPEPAQVRPTRKITPPSGIRFTGILLVDHDKVQ